MIDAHLRGRNRSTALGLTLVLTALMLSSSLAVAGEPILLCGDPDYESGYDDSDWGDAQAEAVGAGVTMDLVADSAVVPGELIPDLPGASASPLATPVSLPYAKSLPGPVTDYALLTASGEFGREYFLEAKRLPAEGFRFVQQKGRSGAQLKPWLAVWNTRTGQGVAILLAWSGNWRLEVQADRGRTVLRADTSPSGLAPVGVSSGLPFPGALVSEFTGHWDHGAQPIARFIRTKLLRSHGPDWPLVQYNSWFASEADIDEGRLLESARAAAELGCELFTVDAGWYGKGTGRDWDNGLGDWNVNPNRFPRGLGPVAAEVRRLGMKLGLWVEIECASPASPVGRAHPDWFLALGGQRLSDRSCLDFGNPRALDWAAGQLRDLISTHRLDYLKIDFNTDVTVDGERLGKTSDPLHGHYRGLTELLKRLRLEHPNVLIENCSTGSMRQDAMTAAMTDTHWVSDNVENRAALALTFGATALFPPEVCSRWTCFPKTGTRDFKRPDFVLDLESQFTVNMMGHFGLSGRVAEWSRGVRAVAAERVARYKQLRPLLRSADVFHLTPQAALYVHPRTGKALLFAFQAGKPPLELTLRLRGLAAGRDYRVTWPQGFGPAETVRGKELLDPGLTVRFPYRGSSAIVTIEPVATDG